jgi:hypothetical protein
MGAAEGCGVSLGRQLCRSAWSSRSLSLRDGTWPFRRQARRLPGENQTQVRHGHGGRPGPGAEVKLSLIRRRRDRTA